MISRPGADDNNRYIGFLGCFDGSVEAGLVVAPSLTALRIVDSGFVSYCGFDAVEGCDASVLALTYHIVAVLSC